MSKTIDFLLAASMVLVAIFISSCSSHSGLEEITLSSGSEGTARSSSSATAYSSSSEEARGSATASSSSSEEARSSATASSSSSEEVRSSATASSSSSEEARSSATASSSSSEEAISSSTLSISCNMASASVYEGTAITPPVLACSDGSVPFDIVFSGYLPTWDNLIAGSYEVLAEANCGQGTLPAVSCGTFIVNPVTLTCGSVPFYEYEGIKINPPDLTCSHGARGTPTWTNAPNWNNPAVGIYNNINVTANCGLATKTTNCNGILSVNPVTLTCDYVPASGISGVAITPPVLTCSNGGAPTDISWLTNAPYWSDPMPGTYSNINVTATCGLTTKTTTCSGILTVDPVTLICGSVPASGISGFAITPPALACNDGRTPTNITWSANAPNWSNPEIGTYSDISSTATCGTESGLTANCSGSLNVSCSGKYNNSTHYCSEGTMKEYGSITYQEQTYKTVVIGTQTWMAENLNYAAEGSKCYDNLDSNCDKYGRLYSWSTALTVCPSGWHLPTRNEWQVMTAYIGGESTEGKMLKATSGWNGADVYGFSALPGGQGQSDGNFGSVGNRGYWWSASVNGFDGYNTSTYARYMYYVGEDARWSYYTSSFFSVRCLKD